MFQRQATLHNANDHETSTSIITPHLGTILETGFDPGLVSFFQHHRLNNRKWREESFDRVLVALLAPADVGCPNFRWVPDGGGLTSSHERYDRAGTKTAA